MGAASSIANDYAITTTEMVHTVIERFNIENIEYYSINQDINV